MRRFSRAFLRLALHSGRAALIGLILLLIYRQHQKISGLYARQSSTAPAINVLQEFLPKANRLEQATAEAGWTVYDQEDATIGFAALTSPAADHIVGFSGPTNVLLVFDGRQKLAGARIVSSQDTQEHIAAIVNDEDFLRPLVGMSRDQLAKHVPLDAVSGATLSSLAIRESIAHRLGGVPRASLRFPQPVALKDAAALFPRASAVSEPDGALGFYNVYDDNRRLLGHLLRTSPAADGLIGYQGPTDCLIGFDSEGRSIGFILKDSFDNEPYVGYVRDDEYFQSLFEGLSVRELSDLDLDAAGIEGVSGATMTSVAIAEGIKRAAGELRRQRERPASTLKRKAINFRPRDWGTLLVVLAGLVIGFTNLRGKKWVRIPFQLLLIGYLGFINGDLVSQALLVGWAEHGVPWRSAAGLVSLTAAAILVPIFSRQNVYCHQICPHGALQQLLNRRSSWRISLPRRVAGTLSAIPLLLLIFVVLVPMLSLPFSLVDLEPFDAYIFRVAGMATILIFVVGLAASLFVPMAYCRFGCPTGAVLGYLRFHSKSDRLNRRDLAAVGLLALALILFAAS